MTQIPNAQGVLNAFGEKGWELRGYYRVEKANLISKFPICKEFLLIGETYTITPKIDDSQNVPAVVARLEYLEREGLGSRLYVGNEEFSTIIIQMHPPVAVFLPTDTHQQPIAVMYADLEKRIRNNFGPNLRTRERV